LNRKIKKWLPAIAWASLILLASSDMFSAAHTRGIIEGFFHWLFPAWTPYSVYKAHLVVRKCAHFFEYAVLAIFVMRGFASEAKAPVSDSPGRGAEAPLSLPNAGPSAKQNADPSTSLGMTFVSEHPASRSLRMTMLGVVLLCAMVATVDEVHQHFVPSRTGSPYDVLLDTTGSIVAMLLLTWRKSSQRAERRTA
jgi:VanZ family protein